MFINKLLAVLALAFMLAVNSVAAIEMYTWTTPQLIKNVNQNSGCSVDASKSWTIVVLMDDTEFAIRTQQVGAQDMFNLLSSARAANKKVQINYWGGAAPEYLNLRVYRGSAKGACSFETNRFKMMRGVSMVDDSVV